MFKQNESPTMKNNFAILSILTLCLSGCAVDWKAQGFEAEEQYKLADARALSPYGAKLFFEYGLTTVPLYDAAMNEMITSNYADKKDSDLLAAYLKDKATGAKDKLSALEVKKIRDEAKIAAENLIKKQKAEVAAKILNKKWASSKEQCKSGTYITFKNQVPGMFFIINGVDSGDKNATIEFDFIPPNKAILKRKFYANKMVGKLAGNPQAITADMSSNIELRDDNVLSVSTQYKQIDMDNLLARKTYVDILRSPPRYVNKSESGTYSTCE
jgi:hypothetical protein